MAVESSRPASAVRVHVLARGALLVHGPVHAVPARPLGRALRPRTSALWHRAWIELSGGVVLLFMRALRSELDDADDRGRHRGRIRADHTGHGGLLLPAAGSPALGFFPLFGRAAGGRRM